MFPTKKFGDISHGDQSASTSLMNKLVGMLNSQLKVVYPLKLTNTAGGLSLSYERPYRGKNFGFYSSTDIAQAGTQSYVVTDADASLSKQTVKDCEGIDVDEDAYSALMYPCELNCCSQEVLKNYSQSVRVYFPFINGPFQACEKVHATYNYDAGRWESDYEGPQHLAVSGTYTKGQSGPSTVNVFCYDAVLDSMVDTGETVEAHFDWAVDPDAESFTGAMKAEWFACDCRWRVTLFCCTATEVEPCEDHEWCDAGTYSDDFGSLPDGYHDSYGDYLTFVGNANSGTLENNTSPPVGESGLVDIARCVNVTGWPVGEYIEMEVVAGIAAEGGFVMSFGRALHADTVYLRYVYDSTGTSGHEFIMSGTIIPENKTEGLTPPSEVTMTLRVTRASATEFDIRGEHAEHAIVETEDDALFPGPDECQMYWHIYSFTLPGEGTASDVVSIKEFTVSKSW